MRMPAGFNVDVGLAVVDLDGTLLTGSGSLSTENADAIHVWIDTGRQFAILTSRSPTGVLTAMGDVGVGCVVGCFNGALLYRHDPQGSAFGHDPPGRPRRLDSASAATIWERFTGLRLPVLWYTVAEVFGNLLTQKVRREIGITGDSLRIQQAQPKPAAYKILCVSDPAARWMDGIDSLIPENCSWTYSRSGNIEILHSAATKANAIREISRLLRVPLDRTLAIGDGDNDVPMFECAGISIAVANASPAARAHASLTTATNDDDGVALALKAFL